MAKVKKRILALSRGTNWALRSHIVLSIKSLVEVTRSHGLNSHMLKWFKSHDQAVFAQREEMKLIASSSEVILRRSDIWRHWRLKWLKWLYSFDLEFRICRTIKMDANLSGLRKIECSSIKIKSKERHSSTSWAHRIDFSDFLCQKSWRKSELPIVGSHDSRRKWWRPVT
jgi:hypothetical protein